MVTKVGWMVDSGYPRAGMVLSVEAFEAAMPKRFELYRCRPNNRPPNDIDIFILHGDLFDKRWIEPMSKKPVLAHRHGGWYIGDPLFRRWILDNASLVTFNSPKQRELFLFPVNAPWNYVPLPIDVRKFKTAAEKFGRNRKDVTVFLGLIAPAKGISYTMDWALRTDTKVHFYGESYHDKVTVLVPPCSYEGSVDYEDVPNLLASYESFVFFPHEPDLYSRTVVEAHAAGCRMVLEGDTKALYAWMDLDACQGAADFFWDTVREVLDGQNVKRKAAT